MMSKQRIENNYDITNNPSYQKMKKENIDRILEENKFELQE